MARDTEIHARLLAWAQYVTGGDGAGHPVMRVLHRQGQAPSPGTTPTMKVSAPSAARQTHRAIGMLSLRLANTLVVHYVLKPPIAEQAERLECAEPTVYARVDAAHRQLRGLLFGEHRNSFCNKEEMV